MKKHTICLEARPFAAFSDEQLNRLTARPDVEVLDCRDGTVDDPAFMACLQSADIVISGISISTKPCSTPCPTSAASPSSAWVST